MLKVVQSPDPTLRTVCEPCVVGDKSLRRLSAQMASTMYRNNGVGIAAPQVGVTKRLIVVDCDWDESQRDPIVLVNPELVDTWGDPVVESEGCLSVPGVSAPVERAPWARVRYYDLDGEQWEIESDGLLGRCLQHEIDHLNGITLFESCVPSARVQLLSAYERARAEGALPGHTAIEVAV
ncbi:peptide deformylase [Berryella wangjianweii]|uniref:Peptide deformylase n=1 Tax=Berryella wangjianweii TaxID=2734634 RepID=A0A6M8J0H2_9ACTN|nr:peptide deformylase [Berryella wangjianweii]QKF07024.1 peptide deformylase [Berryella wangjianweii]